MCRDIVGGHPCFAEGDNPPRTHVSQGRTKYFFSGEAVVRDFGLLMPRFFGLPRGARVPPRTGCPLRLLVALLVARVCADGPVHTLASNSKLSWDAEAVRAYLRNHTPAENVGIDLQLQLGCGLDADKGELCSTNSSYCTANGGDCRIAKPVLLPRHGLLLLQRISGTETSMMTVEVDYSAPTTEGKLNFLSAKRDLPSWVKYQNEANSSGWVMAHEPSDPRGFEWRGRPQLVASSGCVHRGGGLYNVCNYNYRPTLMAMFDFTRQPPESVVLLPPIDAERPDDKLRINHKSCPIAHDEKNWSPLVLHGKVHFVYQHAPLQILRMDGAADGPYQLQSQMAWAFKAPKNATSNHQCRDVRGGSSYMHWRGAYYVSLGHVHCGVLTDEGCRMENWDVDPHHCEIQRKTPRSWTHSCSRAYRTVITVLNTATWELACSPRLTFKPPPDFWQCTYGWRGKWDVQYVHSLERTTDGSEVLIGMEFENRCPSLLRLDTHKFDVLVNATLAGTLEPDVISTEPPLKVSPTISRWAF